ncbi:hypothetical protein DXG03_007882 [Asterophora parasitica]|uniref:ARID domain-containing protein n=1 Tax=Asterophora parasitica TaxID=117018 RepID=A0A9P7G740_9AGAR|nr:hypothetical protein DXG03_007882 [Asterophora parasitica]
MAPQNGQPTARPQHQPGMPPFMASNTSFDPSPYFNNLDPTQAAKQMAALTAASQARIANNRPPFLNPPSGPTSAPFTGGNNPPNYPPANYDPASGPSTQHETFQMPKPPSNPSSFLDPMSQASRTPQHNGDALKHRQQSFLIGLANSMNNMGMPLPPSITGVPTPSYDYNTSRWKHLEPSSEIGHFRLAGKDINIFNLYATVFQSGGGHAVAANNGWGAILAQFDLPEEVPQQPPNGGTVSTAHAIAQIYMHMLLPFEKAYKSNIQEQQRKAMASRQGTQQQQPPMDASIHNRPPSGSQPSQIQRGPSLTSMNPASGTVPPSTMNGSLPFPHPHPPARPDSTVANQPISGTSQSVPGGLLQTTNVNGNAASDGNVLDQELQGIKRKIEYDERDGKRARQKLGSEPPPEIISSSIPTAVDRNSSTTTSSAAQQAATTMSAPPPPRQQPSRRKIEYVPLAREVETYGGRDLKLLETELANHPQRRPIRDIHDWGTVDIEALTMSIRSRLSNELSYALTTFTLLSTMRGQTPGSGFPVFQSPDLFDEVLDLLEEQAFGDVEDSDGDILHTDLPIVTHHELVNLVYEAESTPFAVLIPHQGSKDPKIGPQQRPGNLVLAILNIIRNLSTIPDNLEFISSHTRMIDLMLRICTITYGDSDMPSPSSSALSLGDLAHVRKDVLYTLTNIASAVQLSASSSRAIRTFNLISSYLIDPTDAISPLACVQVPGVLPSGNLKPPALADVALDVFSRLSQTDSNRQIIAKSVPQTSLICLFEALVHRLPVVDADFQLMTRDVWLSYLEKIIMAMYSLAFLAPPVIKQKLKANRALGFSAVMLRMIQKFLMTHDSRVWFGVCTRRAVEAMKVLDDAEDCFDTSKSAVPTMSFGMGFGDAGDNSFERGTGLLGGYRDVTWEMMMLREVQQDEVLFNELESLSRVEC